MLLSRYNSQVTRHNPNSGLRPNVPPGNLVLNDPKVFVARSALLGSSETNWFAYNHAHDVRLPGSKDRAIAFLMFPRAEAVEVRVIRPQRRGFGESVGPVDGVTLRDNAADVAATIEATAAAPAIVGG
jgi:pimeloyl-ACP methyl ester carboxylesterase